MGHDGLLHVPFTPPSLGLPLSSWTCAPFQLNPRHEATASTAWQRLLLWSPRVLCMLLAAFLAIFAADVFGESRPFLTTAAALLIHLIPSALVLLVLTLAWRHPWVGGLVATFLGVVHLVLKWGQLPWSDLLIVTGPLFGIAILFFANSVLLPARPSSGSTAGPAAA